MHPLLERLLKKRNIEAVEQLEEPEKLDFDRWNSQLTGSTVSVEQIQDFCSSQIKEIELKWKSLDNASQKNERLICLHTVYSAILSAIKAPETERENLEKYLTSLIDKA